MFNITQFRRAVLAGLALVVLTCVAAIAQNAPAPAKPACSCGEFRVVSEMEQVRAGDVAEFSVHSTDPTVSQRKFEWTFLAGTIISGQGTGRIRVQTTAEMLNRKPTPQEKAPATANPPGYISRVFTGGQLVRIFVTARIADDAGCACPAVSGSVYVRGIAKPRNVPADVVDLRLSAELLRPGCSTGPQPVPGQPDISTSMIVDVDTVATDPENDVITYNYTVSGGRVIGTGAKVKWNLTDVVPGSYWIEALVDDGGPIPGKRHQREITVEPCVVCGLCICPMVELSGPETISWADSVIFTASVQGGSYSNPITYKWEVTNGLILEGKDSPSIKVSASPDTSVRVKIGGLTWCNCLDELVRVYKNGRLQPQP